MSGYTTAGSGKSMARGLAAIIIIGVILGFDFVCFRFGKIDAIWGAIIASVCALVGTPWAISKWKRSQP